ATILIGLTPPRAMAFARHGNGYLKPMTSSGRSAEAKLSTIRNIRLLALSHVAATFRRQTRDHCKSFSSGASVNRLTCRGEFLMNGKVLVVTGALGALGKVVADTAVTRGA